MFYVQIWMAGFSGSNLNIILSIPMIYQRKNISSSAQPNPNGDQASTFSLRPSKPIPQNDAMSISPRPIHKHRNDDGEKWLPHWPWNQPIGKAMAAILKWCRLFQSEMDCYSSTKSSCFIHSTAETCPINKNPNNNNNNNRRVHNVVIFHLYDIDRLPEWNPKIP